MITNCSSDLDVFHGNCTKQSQIFWYFFVQAVQSAIRGVHGDQGVRSRGRNIGSRLRLLWELEAVADSDLWVGSGEHGTRRR